MRMKHFLFIAFLFFLAACSTVPITGRKQLNLIPSDQLLSMSFQQYDQFLQQAELSDNEKNVQIVKNVGQNIAGAVETYQIGRAHV